MQHREQPAVGSHHAGSRRLGHWAVGVEGTGDAASPRRSTPRRRAEGAADLWKEIWRRRRRANRRREEGGPVGAAEGAEVSWSEPCPGPWSLTPWISRSGKLKGGDGRLRATHAVGVGGARGGVMSVEAWTAGLESGGSG